MIKLTHYQKSKQCSLIKSSKTKSTHQAIIDSTASPLPGQCASEQLWPAQCGDREHLRLIIGVSGPAIRLWAKVWESIFTHDMRRYRRALYERRADFTTLVTDVAKVDQVFVNTENR